MKKIFCLCVGLLVTSPAFANFVDHHENVFRNQQLCTASADQIKDEAAFKQMFSQLKADDEQGRTSIIEVEDYLAYSTRLKNTATGQECSINVYDGCYSTFCE